MKLFVHINIVKPIRQIPSMLRAIGMIVRHPSLWLNHILSYTAQVNSRKALVHTFMDMFGIKKEKIGVSDMIAFMHQYGIFLAIGTCSIECRAVLPKSKWLNGIDETVSQFDYGVFYRKPVEAINVIEAFGSTAEEAIMKCAINARIAGVI